MAYTLLDGIQHHQAHPNTFQVPDSDEIASMAVGDQAKLCFLNSDDDMPNERMWVTVTSIDGDHCAGKLSNHPLIFLGELEYNQLIEFDKKHIIGLVKQGE